MHIPHTPGSQEEETGGGGGAEAAGGAVQDEAERKGERKTGKKQL